MFLHTYQPSPVFLNLGFVQVYWYGFLIALSIVLGFLIFYKLALKAGIKKNSIFDLVFWLVIWGLIGGRLYHILSEIGYYIQNPLQVFYVWNGGLGIYGALIAGILRIYFFARKQNNPPIGYLLDLLVPSLALGQAIGRWGNYFNQELYGQPSNLPWAIPISLANRLPGYENFIYFHPVFLYESLFCLALFIFLFFLTKKWALKTTPVSSLLSHSSRFSRPGRVFLLYIFLYSSWRFFIEFLRIDYQPMFLNLRLGQWVSLILIIFSAMFYFILNYVIRFRPKH